MNYKSIIGLCTAIVLAGTSCTDFDPFDFQVEKPESIILQEELDSYANLKTFLDTVGNPNFRLGASMSMESFANRGVTFRLINRNFNEYTPTNGMHHSSIVQDNGSFNMVNVMNFLNTAKEENMKVVASPLIWHQNQRASVLNSALSPLIVESPAFANELNVQSLASGSLNGWEHSFGTSVKANEGMGGNAPAVNIVASNNTSSPSSARFKSPEIQIEQGKTYEFIAYVKSDVPGEGRITFNGLSNNEPMIDWFSNGSTTETFETNLSWKEIRFRINDFTGDTFSFQFEFGYQAGVSYFLDINNLYLYDINGNPIISNLISNGDFESGGSWGGWGNNSQRGLTEQGQGLGNEGRAFFVTNPSKTGGFWEVQTLYQLAEPVKMNETYNLSFWVKGTEEGIIRPELQSPGFTSNGFGQIAVTRDWRFINVSTTVTADDRNRFIISYGEFAGTVYIDNVVLSSASLSGGSTTVVDRTPDEKSAIITSHFTNWISTFVGGTKDLVKSRYVLHEPLDNDNPNQLRTGVGRSLEANEFYWQDYLGKDYGVLAFKLAREYGNSDDLLFISESGMETKLDKCRALIDYVKYLDDNNARVDGIGVRLQLDLNSSIINIESMFRLLAATGKKIKISGLDVRLNGTSPTHLVLNGQADIYKSVIDLYKSIIPASQQYGITLTNPVDSNNILRQGLWDEGLVRKPAYATVAESLKN
ncbi:endo-1,4-beta-xylanase [Belliella kenyensis]|uniref:endo-1,4-beta-xylanase n=1 Tax=Belliella kenyensis TaxID=1472724 RepID=A0ABV8EPZ4_9BACT|nr:endo-1,4-beta-xylanase [Belliella kenyensis]MCH7402044.1 endo-1,4-beta-xylanase [Belliella kenyensis]MDN3605208.1 endo-1,4-beta-xylanase [Belliella kenyensis]